jgi:ribose-phosphate pyrophosphokinase
MSAIALISLPGNEAMAAKLAHHLGGELIATEMRNFPDGESYFRLERDLHGRSVALVCTLDRPDAKILPLLFAAGTISDLGAASVGLVAPYLAYMRQDRRFHSGEALTCKLFAALLSPHIDWLVTVDPHLHRIHSLGEIYDVPTRVLHAAPKIARWIASEVEKPVLIGPDKESAQWVREVAKGSGADFVMLDKTRCGDKSVTLTMPDMTKWQDYTPVLVDDIISTGTTLLESMAHLRDCGMRPPVCIGVHGIFASGAYESLHSMKPARVVTTNTVGHESNAIDISEYLAAGIREVIA